MAAGAVAALVLGAFLLTRPAPPVFPSPDTGEGTSAAAQTSTPPAARVLAIGDGYTAGSQDGGLGPAGWPKLVEGDLAAAGRAVTVDVSAAVGSGYVSVGPDGRTFGQLAQQATGPYDIVVFFGSRNDQADTAGVQAASAQAFAAVRASSPKARLLVIGPPWSTATPPANVLAASAGVQAAATAAGAAWVDPLVERWFVDRPDLLGSDGVRPNDAGHRYLADLIRPRIEQLLA